MYWLGTALVDALLLLFFIGIPATVAAAASGTFSDEALPAFTAATLVSLVPIILFTYCLSLCAFARLSLRSRPLI